MKTHQFNEASPGPLGIPVESGRNYFVDPAGVWNGGTLDAVRYIGEAKTRVVYKTFTEDGDGDVIRATGIELVLEWSGGASGWGVEVNYGVARD